MIFAALSADHDQIAGKSRMIKPPFTLLILKKSHAPVTIRVTTGLSMVMLAGTLIVMSTIGLGAALSFRGNAGAPSPPQAVSTDGFEVDAPPVENTPVPFDIETFTVNRSREGVSSIELGMTPPREGGDDAAVYVWLILNPAAPTPGERIVHPRNPLFRGYPVDYRNGISYIPREGEHLSIELSQDARGVTTDRVRVLVYSSEGEMLADRFFSRTAQSGAEKS